MQMELFTQNEFIERIFRETELLVSKCLRCGQDLVWDARLERDELMCRECQRYYKLDEVYELIEVIGAPVIAAYENLPERPRIG